mmetsp:Transcript_10504/g.37007  ORF Transcript_10504/g.37007 Transcript_10504/m.37007 type:complete len:474 (-) Transcript_10504:125-1546(-)
MARLPLGFQALGQVAHAAGRVVRIEEEELRGEDDKLQNGLPEKRQVRLPALAEAVAVDVVGRVKGVDDELGREPGEERDAGDAEDAPLVKVLQGALHRLARRGRVVGPRRGQREAELVGVLDGLAAALAEVGHHGVDRVAEQSDGPDGPRLRGRRRPVVQVALLDLVLARVVQNGVHVRRPARENVFEVLGRPLRLFLEVRRACRPRQEGVPLVPLVANVRDDKVLARPDVHLVADLAVVRARVVELPGEDGVPRVGDARALTARGLGAHGSADLGPDAVSANQAVGGDFRAVVELGDYRAELDAAGHGALLAVRRDAVAVAHHARLEAVEQDLLQVGPLDDACVRHTPVRRGRGEVELGVPLVAEAVLDAVCEVARPGELGLDFVVDGAVLRLEDLHGVGGQLDGAAEALERVGLLDDRHVDVVAVAQQVGERQAANAGASDHDTERVLLGDFVGLLRRRGRGDRGRIGDRC